MKESFNRTAALLGQAGIEKLINSHVAIFGIGGVGSYVAEALARSGVGTLTLIDKDKIEESNINRQLIADTTTIGASKVLVARERIQKINPDCQVFANEIFYLPETADQIDFTRFDYVVDAVDTVTAKLCIIEEAAKANVPVISSMGTAGKLDATALKVGDLFETSGDGLAKIMRKECRNRGIEKLKVVYSTEKSTGVQASAAFVPGAAGLIIAGEVIKHLTEVHT